MSSQPMTHNPMPPPATPSREERPKLPSFGELTSQFNKHTIVEQAIPRAPQPTGPPQQVLQAPEKIHCAPQVPPVATPVTSAPPRQPLRPAPELFHHQPPPQRPKFQHPRYQPQTPQESASAQSPASAPIFSFRYPRSPVANTPAQFQRPPQNFTPISKLNFNGPPSASSVPQSAPPTGPNYVATPPQNPGFVLPLPSGDRRHSFPTHAKQNSYDSQTSLSTLADIASTSTDELQTLMGRLEECLNRHSMVSSVLRDFARDMQDQYDKGTSQNPSPIPLKYQYLTHAGKPFHSIDAGQCLAVLRNIPMHALQDLINWLDEMRMYTEDWMRYRVGHGEQPAQRNFRDSQLAAAKALPQEQQAQDQTQGHSRAGSNTNKRRGSAEGKVAGNKRKPAANANRETDVALVVRAPTPLVAGSSGQPTDTINEDLSIREAHICKQCGSIETPEWRRGPYGSRSLCNACGLFYSKLLKRMSIAEADHLMYERRERGQGDDRRIPLDRETKSSNGSQ